MINIASKISVLFDGSGGCVSIQVSGFAWTRCGFFREVRVANFAFGGE